MPIDQRRSIITCLPKGNKPRQFLKNWRPISLLNVYYKIITGCIANRIKPILDILISDTQTGFIKGRYIGENTRLIYDIMNYTDINNIPGLLVLIDFEKGFDSLAKSFIYKVLDFFNFGQVIKNWIKIFNFNISSSVIQNGFVSNFFSVKRDCRQGDPISPYIFILCAEILSVLIKKCKDIKGISINGREFKISQFADDTSLILNGSQESLFNALKILDKFANI